MSPPALPSEETLARLVSTVTETMFGMSFEMAAAASHLELAGEPPSWRAATLPIGGRSPVAVLIASDRAAGRGLAAAMFGCDLDEVDGGMEADALCELVNIFAGQVKAEAGLEALLGLPTVVPVSSLADLSGWRSATLHRRGGALFRVWVALRRLDEEAAAA